MCYSYFSCAFTYFECVCVLVNDVHCEGRDYNRREFYLECPAELLVEVRRGNIATRGSRCTCCPGCDEDMTPSVLTITQKHCDGHTVCRTPLFSNLSNTFTGRCLSGQHNAPIQLQWIRYTCTPSHESNQQT